MGYLFELNAEAVENKVNDVSVVLGIDQSRGAIISDDDNTIRDIVNDCILKDSTVHEIFVRIAALCETPQELAYTFYNLGRNLEAMNNNPLSKILAAIAAATDDDDSDEKPDALDTPDAE